MSDSAETLDRAKELVGQLEIMEKTLDTKHCKYFDDCHGKLTVVTYGDFDRSKKIPCYSKSGCLKCPTYEHLEKNQEFLKELARIFEYPSKDDIGKPGFVIFMPEKVSSLSKKDSK